MAAKWPSIWKGIACEGNQSIDSVIMTPDFRMFGPTLSRFGGRPVWPKSGIIDRGVDFET